METPPIKLLRRADLIRIAEVIHPALLLRAPAAAPSELEHMRRAVGLRFDGPVEIGAPRRTGDGHAVDREVGLRREHVLQKSLNFHRREVRVDTNAGRFTARVVRSNIRFELLMRARPREQCLQLLQDTTSWVQPNSASSPYAVNKYRMGGPFIAPSLRFSLRKGNVILHAPQRL